MTFPYFTPQRTRLRDFLHEDGLLRIEIGCVFDYREILYIDVICNGIKDIICVCLSQELS